jgi:predicted acylesterase/phospholipase RssA
VSWPRRRPLSPAVDCGPGWQAIVVGFGKRFFFRFWARLVDAAPVVIRITGVCRVRPKTTGATNDFAVEQLGQCARLAALLCLTLAIGACGSLPRNPAPPQRTLQATIPHLPDVRAWAGQPSKAMERDLAQSFAQESPQEFPRRADGSVRYAHLALSGGGANGAFGAGYLNGWTTTGTRPVFKIVTGVSTGALMAPFAFLGPEYDDALREFYTTTSTRDVFVFGSLLPRLLGGESLADTGPLKSMIERHIDAELLRKVAEAHQRGRRLYVGTTDLDVPAFVVWNMGLIASSGRPEALDLFRKVMLASASIPVAFPPVFFEVELEPGGPRYDEMHVDGGVGARVFLTGGVFRGSVVRSRGGHGGVGYEDIFVIHNGQLVPIPNPVDRSLPAIATRVIESAGRSAAIGDLFRIFSFAQTEGAGFQWITIPDDVAMGSEEFFDPRLMQSLYEVGFRLATTGGAWRTLPPGRSAEP